VDREAGGLRAARAWRWLHPRLALLAPPAAGLLHALYVVRVGGDFMHARLLLPGLFALLLPVMVVVPRRLPEWAAVAVAATWALALTTVAPPHLPYQGIGPRGIADERATWVGLTGRLHPVMVEDYRQFGFWQAAEQARSQLTEAEPKLVMRLEADFVHVALRDDAGAQVTLADTNVGVAGFAAGGEIRIVDLGGLADPIAARLRRGPRSRPGHEKHLEPAWVWARFVVPGAPAPASAPAAHAVEDARRALDCPAIRRLLAATSEPLTPGRFLRNLGAALPLHHLRIDRDPAVALTELCGDGPLDARAPG
ncbi:MAG: hypothetical protein ACRDZ7_10165, partial [Acidimicrobiia bacterium]